MPRLSREQEELRDALARVDQRLGPIYVGGLRVLEDDSNPDRFAQSAHSMRELMEKIEEWFAGGGGGKQPTPLKVKVIEVADFFAGRRSNSSCHSLESGWSGEIDRHLSKALDKLDKFFEWFAQLHPRRRELFERMLTRLDPSDIAFVSSSWKHWKEIRDYFIGVSHHRRGTNLAALREQISRLEIFLAARLLPKTSEDLDAIDALVEEAHDA